MARLQAHPRTARLRPASGSTLRKFSLKPIVAVVLTLAGGAMLLGQGEPAANGPVSAAVLAAHSLLDDAAAFAIRFNDIKISDFDPNTGILRVPTVVGTVPVHLSPATIQAIHKTLVPGAGPGLLPRMSPWIKLAVAAPLAAQTPNSNPNTSMAIAADIGDDFANGYIELGSIKASDVTLSSKLAQISVNGSKITVPLSDATTTAISALGQDRTDGQYTLFGGPTGARLRSLRLPWP